MGRGRELEVVGYLLQADGPPRPIESLSAEELEVQRRIWRDRLSRTMSDYYTQHPEEYIATVRWLEQRDAQKQEGSGENDNTAAGMGGDCGRAAAG